MNGISVPPDSSVIGSATAWPAPSLLSIPHSGGAEDAQPPQSLRRAASSSGLLSRVTMTTSVQARSARGSSDAR